MVSLQSSQRLEWDSKFFGYNIGYIDIQNDELINPLNFPSNFDLIYLMSNKELTSNQIPKYIDIKLNYKKKSNEVFRMPQNVEIYNGDLCEILVELSILSGLHSRFKRDTKLNPFFNQLYTIWIEKSIRKSLSDFVLVYKISNKIVGLITLLNKNENVEIGLLSVSDTQWGKGIGSSLLNSIPVIFPKKDILVSTQGENIQASALYTKNNFFLESKKYIYHLWK